MTALVAPILLAAAIHLDQHLLRQRAERLQSDIRLLELRKNTYADARRFEDRWFEYAKEGVCRPQWCDLQILLADAGFHHLQLLIPHPTAFAVYRALGGRVACVYSFIRVRDSVLWGKGIGLSIDVSSTESDGRRVQYQLEGSVGTDPILSISARHPEYQMGSPTGCLGCKAGWVNFTPFADPQDVRRLTDVNFTCITRWQPCTEQADILPSAWKEVRLEGPDRWQIHSCTPAMVRVLSRQTHRIDLVAVIKLQPEGNLPLVTVRRLPEASSQPDQWQELSLVFDPSDGIHLGDRMLVLDDMCRLVRATQENLNAARLGAMEGWSSPAQPLVLPFGPFKPPKVDVP